ncbi:MAG: hypothetical protein IPK26_20630 [Planctomycetes bacterium]|nr:hypothetical protein [Planctomycetota bacterium]
MSVASLALAQSLVADLVPGPRSTLLASVGPIAGVPGAALFAAADPVYQSRLWRTDGTPAGTFPVSTGGPSALQVPSFVWNGVAYYKGSSFVSGNGLWRSDGTPNGTYPLRTDIALPPSTHRGFATGPGGRLYFFATDPAHGTELWSTDGTPAGTSIVIDLRPGPASMLGTEPWRLEMMQAGPWLYFRASHDGGTPRLWRTDGTEANTAMVVPGVGGYQPNAMADLGGVLIYASDEPSGVRGPLWRTDGTPAGTQQVTQGPVAINLANDFAVANGRYIFTVFLSSIGYELYSTDGTTVFGLGDRNPGPANFTPGQFVTLGGFAYFTATTAAHGTELWRSDGTAAGTGLVADVVPGPTSSSITNLTVANGALWFSAYDPTFGQEPWRSDGTAAGTVPLGDLYPGPAPSMPISFVAAPNGVLFRGDSAELAGTAFFVADGSTTATRLQPPAMADAAIDGLAASRGRAYFTAKVAATGREPWSSDGTPGGTQMLVDATPGGADSLVSAFVDYRGETWFLARSRLWRTRGTAATTSLAINGEFSQLSRAGDWLYLTTSGAVLRSDGTVAGTTTVFNPPGTLVFGVAPHGDQIVIAAGANTYQISLFRNDGTPGGNRLFFTANANGFGNLENFTLDDHTIWVADRAQVGGVSMHRVFALPATSANLVNVYQAAEGDPLFNLLFLSPFATRLTTFAGECYFSTAADRELWRTNGTAPATILEVRPGPLGCAPNSFVAGNGYLWFSADDGSNGRELWRTDGTMAGTSMLDVVPGPGGIAPSGLARLDDSSLIVFEGSGPDGAEPWVSDGTLGGTYQLADLRPGPASSFPRFGAVAGNDWLLVADDGVVGAELRHVPVASLGGTLARSFGHPCFHPGGHSMSIAARGVPSLGNTTFAFELHGAEPVTFAGLLVGFGMADLPLPAGCRLWVDDPVLLVSFTNGAGGTSVGLAIPPDPVYLGTPVAGQFLALDPPGGPAAFALTGGLSILVGN